MLDVAEPCEGRHGLTRPLSDPDGALDGRAGATPRSARVATFGGDQLHVDSDVPAVARRQPNRRHQVARNEVLRGRRQPAEDRKHTIGFSVGGSAVPPNRRRCRSHPTTQGRPSSCPGASAQHRPPRRALEGRTRRPSSTAMVRLLGQTYAPAQAGVRWPIPWTLRTGPSMIHLDALTGRRARQARQRRTPQVDSAARRYGRPGSSPV